MLRFLERKYSSNQRPLNSRVTNISLVRERPFTNRHTIVGTQASYGFTRDFLHAFLRLQTERHSQATIQFYSSSGHSYHFVCTALITQPAIPPLLLSFSLLLSLLFLFLLFKPSLPLPPPPPLFISLSLVKICSGLYNKSKPSGSQTCSGQTWLFPHN